MKIDIINIFSFFVKRINGYETKLDSLLVDKFISILEKQYGKYTLGEQFVWDYISFQFAYWVDKKTRMNGIIPPNWIFGSKALERWFDKDQETWLYFTTLFLVKYEIKRPIEFYKQSLNEIYEQERRRFFNKFEGYVNCQSFSKYSSLSPSCIVCEFNKLCIRSLN